ncbi:MAG: hypothetical protein MZW92_31525 [Comamonadaceae bacterium]|nr:hypothetical protein [Comamonadaceae bacterium]
MASAISSSPKGISDRFTVNYGDLIYWTRDRDNALWRRDECQHRVTVALPWLPAPSSRRRATATPIQVIPSRLVMSFEYDNPRLAEATQLPAASEASDFARYRIRKAYQDVVLAVRLAARPFPSLLRFKYDLPTGRVHPTTNIIDASSGGKLSLDKVPMSSAITWTRSATSARKILYVSPIRFNEHQDLG